MTQKDLYGLRYFLALALMLIGFYVYSGVTGLKWVGGTKTEKEKHQPRHGTYPRYYHHK
jgi:hypothetical protein